MAVGWIAEFVVMPHSRGGVGADARKLTSEQRTRLDEMV
jgi:hypothetical protein